MLSEALGTALFSILNKPPLQRSLAFACFLLWCWWGARWLHFSGFLLVVILLFSFSSTPLNLVCSFFFGSAAAEEDTLRPAKRSHTEDAKDADADNRKVKRQRTDARDAAERVIVGQVKRLLSNKSPPFGFITPEDGGPDLFFNERLLGGDKTWAEFSTEVQRVRIPRVLFRVRRGSDHRDSASGVVLLSRDSLDDLDENRDGKVSDNELEHFLAEHPEFREFTRTKQEIEYERKERQREEQTEANEAEAIRREELFKRQNADEDAIWERRDAELAKAAELSAQGEELWQEGEQCWKQGERWKTRELQDRAKKVQAEAQQHRQQAQVLKMEAQELDWRHNEEMFQFVQESHHDKLADGSWLDLHGLSGDFAEHKTQEALSYAKYKGVPELEIITGAGNHSGRRGPVIKMRILRLLQNSPTSLVTSFKEENHGSFIVYIA